MGVKHLLDLSGRTALVTGGSRGLGLQIAEVLGELGARVALVARKGDELHAAVAHLATQNIEGVPFVCDLSDAGDPRWSRVRSASVRSTSGEQRRRDMGRGYRRPAARCMAKVIDVNRPQCSS
jgi:NAD(P)-dependent dehydrogenase (short-subunit alcohol dehydrogenase family)